MQTTSNAVAASATDMAVDLTLIPTVPQGIFIKDEPTYQILHDAINDYIAAPINRANHVQGLLNGLNLKSNSFEILADSFTQVLVDDIITHLESVYPLSEIKVSTMIHDNKMETFFISIYQDVEVFMPADPAFAVPGGTTMVPKTHRYFQGIVAGSKYIKFINVITPYSIPFTPHQQFFSDLMPPKAFTVTHFDGESTKTIPVSRDTCVVYPEFYPFIKGGPDRLIDGFYKSNSDVMIFSGITGSGKSSLIRRLFAVNENMQFVMVDNPAIYQDPKMFGALVNMVHDKCSESKKSKDDDGKITPVTLILEEMDFAVQSKKTDQSGTLARLLSLSSGVVKLPLKIVITTNLASVDMIDENLRRAGRTYKVISFRPLSLDESNDSRRAIGKKPVLDYGVKEVTLAIALNYVDGETDVEDVKNSQKRGMGF